MTPAVRWKQIAVEEGARLGVLHTAHGSVRTPAFMPVGTGGAVKTVDSADLERIGTDMVLANTYHRGSGPAPTGWRILVASTDSCPGRLPS